ncbi:hypothetical protein VTL71DRAFT_15624 [Oculimacula yallundae]|uniref:Uncharacterized protein n=1 Tax=Oculimacula yallundae TaxID=86028 RepID=A0ABR4CJ78_9HELO
MGNEKTATVVLAWVEVKPAPDGTYPDTEDTPTPTPTPITSG